MAKLFFLLSGEHPTLPFSELKAILEAESYRHQVLGRWTQVVEVEAETESVKSVEQKSAMTRMCSVELLNCEANATKIFESAHSLPFEGFLGKDESFAVRMRRVRESAPHLVVLELERKLGEIIFKKVKGAKVNLKKPQKTFFGVLTENRFLLGLKLAEIFPKPFMERRPRKRPFFHPSAMPPKLARCMVNLAKPRSGELLVDPFCGTASLLIEAGLIGCRVIGFDVQRRMVNGSLRNLRHYGVEPEGVAVADARKLPITEAHCIVTDPPYGTSATTLGLGAKQVVNSFLSSVGDRLSKGKRICMAAPKSVKLGKTGRDLGFKHVESHSVYVHRSLTREIAVFEVT